MKKDKFILLDSLEVKKYIQNINFKFYKYNEVESTNLLAHKLKSTIEKAGIIVSNIQTAGKGRRGRKWISNSEKNIYMSIVINVKNIFNDFKWDKDKINQFNPVYSSIITGIALYDTVIDHIFKEDKKSKVNINYRISNYIEYDFKDVLDLIKLKFPNDLYINGKKCGGILVESSFLNDEIDYLIIGIGLNVNENRNYFEKLEFKATSLKSEFGYDFNKDELISSISERVIAYFKLAYEKGVNYFYEHFKKIIFFPDKKFSYYSNGSIIYCEFINFEDNFKIRVRDINTNEENKIKIFQIIIE